MLIRLASNVGAVSLHFPRIAIVLKVSEKRIHYFFAAGLGRRRAP